MWSIDDVLGFIAGHASDPDFGSEVLDRAKEVEGIRGQFPCNQLRYVMGSEELASEYEDYWEATHRHATFVAA